MICENSCYASDDSNCKPTCKNPEKAKEDQVFGNKCPLIYYCTINKRFEQTTDMFECPYREDNVND